MVGVPRSSGCGVCIKRRVKCDETRPSCTKCQTYGVSCPGYQKTFKFVERAHGRQNKLQFNGKEDSTQIDHDAMPIADATMTILSRLQRKPSFPLFESSITTMINSSAVNQAQCLSAWINDLTRDSSSNPNEISIARMFVYIPMRMGTSVALDAAIRCLTVHHLGITRGDEGIIRHARYVYGKAMSNLQKAIYNPEESLASGTLCATMVLSVYELFACTNPDSWMKHAAGVRRMMQLRGAASFENDFDLSMLLAYRPMLIMEALFSGKPNFLETEEWQIKALPSASGTLTADFWRKANALGKCLSACPWLVSEGLSLREADKSEISTIQRVVALLRFTLDVQDQLKQWYEDFATSDTLPKEVPSSTNDKVYPLVYRYCDVLTANMFCGYYAITLIVTTILMDCQHPAGDPVTLFSTVDNICKSVEYIAETGILAPYRLGFSLRIAYEVGTITNKLWIRKWLVKFAKFYKACSPENFPPIDIPENPTELVKALLDA